MRRMNNETTIHTQTENTYYYRIKCAEPHSLTGSSGRPDTQPEWEERWIYNSQWTAMQLLYFFFLFHSICLFSKVVANSRNTAGRLSISLSLPLSRFCSLLPHLILPSNIVFHEISNTNFYFVVIYLEDKSSMRTYKIHTNNPYTWNHQYGCRKLWTLRIDFLNVHIFWLFRTMSSLQHPCVLRIARLFGVFGLYSCRNQIFSIVFRVPEFVSADIVTFVMFWLPRQAHLYSILMHCLRVADWLSVCPGLCWKISFVRKRTIYHDVALNFIELNRNNYTKDGKAWPYYSPHSTILITNYSY